MFHSKTLSNKINFIHERALRITYNDRKSTFEELLSKLFSIHHRNLQVFAREMFKIKINMAPETLNEIFQNRTLSCNLRKNSSFPIRQVHSIYHGTESLSLPGPKIWELVSDDIKQPDSLEIFKLKIGFL